MRARFVFWCVCCLPLHASVFVNESGCEDVRVCVGVSLCVGACGCARLFVMPCNCSSVGEAALGSVLVCALVYVELLECVHARTRDCV